MSGWKTPGGMAPQFGDGLVAVLPRSAGLASPCLILRAVGFKLLPSACELAGECAGAGAGGLDVVVADLGVFSELTRQELTALSAKMDRAAETGEAEGYDHGVTSEVHGVQADLYDARADAFCAAAGKPEAEREADREAEAGQ